MIFPIVWLLTHAARCNFSKLVLFVNSTFFLCIQIPVIFTFFSTKDPYSRCAARTQSNW